MHGGKGCAVGVLFMQEKGMENFEEYSLDPVNEEIWDYAKNLLGDSYLLWTLAFDHGFKNSNNYKFEDATEDEREVIRQGYECGQIIREEFYEVSKTSESSLSSSEAEKVYNPS